MTADVTILGGPAGAGKTARLLDVFLTRALSAPGTALWIGPTRRAVEAVRERLLRQVRSLVGARLCTFSDFVEEIVRVNDPGLRPLSGVQQRLLLDEILSHLDEGRHLSHFDRVLGTRGFQDGLLALLLELKRADIDPPTFARAAYRRSPQPITPRERQCARVYARYQHELRRQRLADAEGRPGHACSLMRAGPIRPFDNVQYVFVDGFIDFTPAQRELLTLLANRVAAMWIALPDEPGDERAELFARARATRTHLQRLQPRSEYLDAATASAPARPAGLVHLERQLFRPLRQVVKSACADGIACIEAPGMLGEVRLVARAVKERLLNGVAADDMLIVLREAQPYADLLREVFDDYGIPVDVEGTESLARNPAVALLLRALRLPEDDWPFAGVTALLRNTYFRPRWPENEACAELPQLSEALLRLLGEPRGRDAYLAAVHRWEEKQQPGLEDEQAEESKRRRTHELARQCAPFLQRFFHAWDGAPARAPLVEHVAWLRQFAELMGVQRAADEDERDHTALACLWSEIDAWLRREQAHAARPLDRKTFQRRLNALAAEAGMPRRTATTGCVPVLSAVMARHLEADYVFVMGLGERSFPRLTPPPSLLDDSERQALRDSGLDLPGGDLMPEEMLLFYQVVTRARRQLVLSYPAVDERGQELLPSSFLLTVRDCFTADVLPTLRRSMLLEGYEKDEPLSATEYRVRVAAVWQAHGPRSTGLPEDLEANLGDASDLIRLRFREKEHNPYDGLFRDPAAIAAVSQLFGPERILSPTALEDYVACPFRFFLRHVLRLEPLENPREEIEVTRRGQAFHRALARLHRKLKDDGIHHPTELVRERMLHEMRASVDEDVSRAPSPASKALWRIEGERLLRVAARYGAQWQKFLEPWQKQGVQPRPHLFEVDFGLATEDGQVPHGPLVIREGDIEVRISGRIDRVDVVEMEGGAGFWIIDYKTGSSSHYTSPDLAELRRLQLTLYALAVEEVLLADRAARPLGLAYWLVSEAGPKVALPARNQVLWLQETERWRRLRQQLRQWVALLVGNIRRGAFPLQPRSDHCTQTCPFGPVCRITQARAVGKRWDLPLPTADEND